MFSFATKTYTVKVCVSVAEEKEHSDPIAQRSKYEISRRIIFTSAVVVVVASLIFMWLNSKRAASNTIVKIYEENMETHSEAMTLAISDYIKQLENPTRYLLELSYDPHLIDCSSDNIRNFVEYSRAVRSSSRIPIYYLFNGVKDGNFCAISWVNDRVSSSDFDMYYGVQDVSGKFEVRKFDNVYDFNNFHFDDGVVTDFPIIDHIYPSLLDQSVSEGSLTYIKDASARNSSLILDTQYINIEDSLRWSSTCVSFTNFISYITAIADSISCSYMILTPLNEILIDSFGTEDTNLSLSHVNESNNELWIEFNNQTMNLTNENTTRLMYNDKLYLVKVSNVSYKGVTKMRIILVLPLSEPLDRINFQVSLIFVISSLLLYLIFFIRKLCIQYFERVKQRKIANTTELNKSNGYSNATGFLLETVHGLWTVKEKYPDHPGLNNLAYDIIKNLTQPRDVLLSPVDDDVTIPEPPLSVNYKPFLNWMNTYSPFFESSFDSSLDFDFKYFSIDTNLKLLKLLACIISKHRLYIDVIDPDFFLLFASDFLKDLVDCPITAASRVWLLFQFITDPLNGWIIREIDLFILVISVLTVRTKHDDNVYTYRGSTEFKREKAFRDIWTLFTNYIPYCDDDSEFTKYFKTVYYDMYIATGNNGVFDLIGDFLLVIESPDFKPTENILHNHVFMKALIKLCDYSIYFTDKETMINFVNEWKERSPYLSKFNDTTVMEFHVNVMEKIVSPLLNGFINISPLGSGKRSYYRTFTESLEALKAKLHKVE